MAINKLNIINRLNKLSTIGGGISPQSYWTNMISATVENAAPTHVVLTFASPKNLVASDITIAGFTVNSASWAGSVMTLVLSTSVIYGDSVVATFVKTGQTKTVTNNVAVIAEYLAVKTAMGTQPSTADAVIQNKLLKYLVDNGYYAKAEFIDIFATHTGGQNVNWRNPGTHDPAPVNAPPFAAYEGYTGVPVGSKYVRSHFNMSTDATVIGKDNVCVILGFGLDVISASYDFGSQGASFFLVQIKSGVTNVFCNDMTAQSIAITSGKTHFAMSRGASGSYYKGNNLFIDSSPINSTVISDQELFICARNISGSPSVSNNQCRYAMLFSYLNDYEIRDVIGAMEEYLANYSTQLMAYTIAYPVNSTKQALSIPTSVVGNDECLHPSVVNIGAKWNGYQYWMVCTPYPFGDRSYEDPEIFVSDDGINWIVPVGGSNPILPHIDSSPSEYSDPDLYYEAGTLYLTYRSTEIAGRSQIRMIKSTDGITWNVGNPAIIYDSSVSGYIMGAGTLVKVGATYYYYAESNNPAFAPSTLGRISCATIDGTYSNEQALSVTYTAVAVHEGLKIIGGKYYLVTAESLANNLQIAMRVSNDGVTFTNDGVNLPLVYNTKVAEIVPKFYKKPHLCYVGSRLMCYHSIENTGGAGTYIQVEEIKLV